MVSAQTMLGLMIGTLVLFTGLGVWYSRGRIGTAEDFISARGSMGQGMTTATLIASVMGVWIFLSPAEAGAAFGGLTAVLGYGVGEALPMLAYMKLGPRIRELIPDGHSLTEYTLARYGPIMYGFILLVSLFYMFIFLAAELTGITSAFSLIGGIPRWQTAVLIGGFVLVYTGYGGLRASIFTDTIQTLVILPLLVIGAVGALITLGGPSTIHAQIVQTDPSLLDPGFFTGLRFGFWVAIAILGAELINQTWWQRIYAAKDAETLTKGFRTAALANFLIVFLAGLFGVIARGYVDIITDPADPGYNASIAFFVLINDAFPDPIIILIGLLALLLVMSTVDTLFNAIASIVTADLPRLLDNATDRTLILGARGLTVIVAILAIYVSLRARSVLRLFLLADLFGAAVMVPLLSGLYSRRVPGTGATLAGISGLVVGIVFFPNPVIQSILLGIPIVGPVLPTPDFLVSFVGAALVSTLVTGVVLLVPSKPFDLSRLAKEIKQLDTSNPSDTLPREDGDNP